MKEREREKAVAVEVAVVYGKYSIQTCYIAVLGGVSL